MKTVTLPREWNSPDEPPKANKDVLVKLKIKVLLIRVMAYEDGIWYDPDSEESYFEDVEDAKSEIIGWLEIKQP